MFFFCIRGHIKQMVGHIIHLLLLGLNPRRLLLKMAVLRSKQILLYLRRWQLKLIIA
nr:MAG TPA: hypothetical protein [Bacteriophage sp.]